MMVMLPMIYDYSLDIPFIRIFFGPILSREYNVAFNESSALQDKVISLVNDIVVMFYLIFVLSPNRSTMLRDIDGLAV